jgi:hypothetical protein
MHSRVSKVVVAALVAACTAVILSSRPVYGQQPSANLPGADLVKSFVKARTAKGFVMPKTPWGDPDIQGVFTTKDEANTPFEQPDEWAGRKMEDITPKEFAEALVQRQQAAVERAPFAGGGEEEQGVAIAVPIHWFDNLAAQNARPWFVIEPEGKVPPLRADAKTMQNQGRPCADSTPSDIKCMTSYADRTLSDRCITFGGGGMFRLPGIYGNSHQIIQTKDHVIIRHEMVHEARIVPLDGRARTPKALNYMGQARGYWDGDTLVVETTNFNPRLYYRNFSTGNLRTIERFTRISPTQVEWSMTIDNPQVWTKPWTYSLPLTEDNQQIIYEYACHEGNFGMANLLSGARSKEQGR